MGEKKICSSCGGSMPVDATFCPGCGQKQEAQADEVMQNQSIDNGAENLNSEVNPLPSSVPEETPEPKASLASDMKEINSYDDMLKQATQPTQHQISQPAVNTAPVQKPTPAPVQQPPAPPRPAVQQPQQTQNYQQTQGYQQPPQGYQQPYYPNQPVQQPVAPQKPKKKFPWGFTIIWLIMLGFVGVWTYFFMDSGYDRPEITIDTVRVLIYTFSVIALIYTLNLKLITRKLKVIPTIILVILLLASFMLFSAYELVDGDFLHDMISPVTDSFLPTLE